MCELTAELMDAIYLHNKFSKPCSWDMYLLYPSQLTKVVQSPQNRRLCMQKLASARYVSDLCHRILIIQVNLGSTVQETGAYSQIQIEGDHPNRYRSELYLFQDPVVGCFGSCVTIVRQAMFTLSESRAVATLSRYHLRRDHGEGVE